MTQNDHPLPSLADMAFAFATSISIHVLDGLGNASQAEQARRAAICDSCSLKRSDGRCAACGCWLSEKIPMRSASCLVGRW